MPEVTVDSAAAALTLDALDRLAARLPQQLDQAVEDGAEDLAAEIRQLPRRTHAALKDDGATSQPGQPPEMRTGQLYRSVRVGRGRRPGGAVRTIATAFHGRFLEVGADRGEDGGRLAPRPFATLARQNRAAAFHGRIERAVHGLIEDATA